MSDTLSPTMKPKKCVVVDVSLTQRSEDVAFLVTRVCSEHGLESSIAKLHSVGSTGENARLFREWYPEIFSTVFVLTEVSKRPPSFFDDIVQAVLANSTTGPRILTVHEFPNTFVPDQLRGYQLLDRHGHHAFEEELCKIFQGWMRELGTSVLTAPGESKSVPVHATNCDKYTKENHSPVDTTDGVQHSSHMDKNVGVQQSHQQTMPLSTTTRQTRGPQTSSHGIVGQSSRPNSSTSDVNDMQLIANLPISDDPPANPDQIDIADESQPSVSKDQIFELIANSKSVWYDLYKVLLMLRKKTNLNNLHSDPDGLNPLHAIVEHGRTDFMSALSYLGIFGCYLQQAVSERSPSSYRGLTPIQMAAAPAKRTLQDSLEEIEKVEKSRSVFLQACHRGDLHLVRTMVESNNLVLNDRDLDGNNCLFWAVVSNNFNLFTYLLDINADYTNVNRFEVNLLHATCQFGHHQFISVLLTRCRLDAKAMDCKKNTPLGLVAKNGDVDSLNVLLKHKVPLDKNFLCGAAECGRLTFLKYVLEQVKPKINADVQSPMMAACVTGHENVVEYLLTKGASPNFRDSRYRTPLHIACSEGHGGIVKILLDNGAVMDAQDRYTGHDSVIVVRGTDQDHPNWRYLEVQRSKAHVFAETLRRHGALDLKEFGDVIKSGPGMKPDQADCEWLEKFCASRIPTCGQTPPDMTPLHVAIFRGHPDVAGMLIERETGLNIQDSFGLTPYMLCAMRGDRKTAALLDKKGINTDRRDKNGRTALEIAALNCQTDMANFIKEKDYIKKSEEYLQDSLTTVLSTLDERHLEKMRREAKDVRRHIIDTVRELTIANNILLMELGSGPVMRASGGPPRQAGP